MTPEHKAKFAAAGLAARQNRNGAICRQVASSQIPEVREYAAKSVSPKYRAAYLRAMAGKSRVTALRVKCMDCGNYVRIEVADCRVTVCPLWPYRPFREKKA